MLALIDFLKANLVRSILLMFCAILLGNVSTFAQCNIPNYYIGRNFSNSQLGAGSLYISILPSDFSVDKLICLTQNLKETHHDWKSAMILFFSSPDAANHFQPSHADYEDRLAWTKWAAQLHATYSFDANAHQEFIEIMPLGYEGDTSSNTRINLPVGTEPRCRLEMKGRCVIAMEKIEYPIEALQRGISSSIRLTGIVTSNGDVQNIHIVNSEEPKTLLTNTSIRNLSSWHLEPTEHQEEIQITYSFVIDRSLPNKGQSQVEWTLPQVTIRGNPLE